MAFVLDIFFSAVGSAYLLYGRRQYDVPFLVAGFILLVYPYFVSSVAWVVLIGVVVAAGPFAAAKLA